MSAQKKHKGRAAIFAVLLVLSALILPARAEEAALSLDAQSAILMEASTGQVFYEQNADQALPPASVTKIMTLLLVMEAVDGGAISLSDSVQTSEHAASMGGSQIYLKVGELMSVEDMIKSVVIASANDAAVALAEYVSGSEEAFVARMNERAAELGMRDAHFENTNGLDDSVANHVCSARDIAIMSCELLRHKKILEYSSIWMDTVRGGEFGLTNTNRLIRFYNGANGLKTGSTSRAKFCISATAERDGMQLVAVIMASPTRDVRNECAKKLLDYGFANYARYQNPPGVLDDLTVYGGIQGTVPLSYGEFSAVVPKGELKNITQELSLPEYVAAPIRKGDPVGEMIFRCGEQELGRIPVCAEADNAKISFLGLMGRLFRHALLIN